MYDQDQRKLFTKVTRNPVKTSIIDCQDII